MRREGLTKEGGHELPDIITGPMGRLSTTAKKNLFEFDTMFVSIVYI